MKLFQMATNWKRKTVNSPGSSIGVAMDAKIRHSEAPSVRAASMTSSGTVAAA